MLFLFMAVRFFHLLMLDFLLKQLTYRYQSRLCLALTMDAQWQQYYWNHYLMHQQQLVPGSDTAHYTPTSAYGPMGHSIRMHQQHQPHPYTPPPSTSPPTHTPPSHTPPATTSPAFPPPPPPPLPTASPTTPQPKSFQRSPTPSAPPVPPATVPFPTPTIQDSWQSTESCWDAHAVHGHQLHRHIQPTQWSRRVGIAGLPTFEVFPLVTCVPWDCRFYRQGAQSRQVLRAHSHAECCRVCFHHPSPSGDSR